MILKNTDQTLLDLIVNSIPKTTVVAEFAGRDSVAAILKALESNDINGILPIISTTGTEYGDSLSVSQDFMNLKNIVRDKFGEDKHIYPLLNYSRPDLWSIINGKYVYDINKKFGFYTPCIGCHGFLHIIRVGIASRLSGKIITGERISHDGKIKINQTENITETFRLMLSTIGIDLIQPIKHLTGKEIENIIGVDWKEGQGHLKCVYSGNYKSIDGSVDIDSRRIDRYVCEYLIPVSIKLGQLIKEDNKNIASELDYFVRECLKRLLSVYRGNAKC